jgi:hypothetical protein
MKPEGDMQRAADAAMDEFKSRAEAAGAVVEYIFITATVEGAEPNAVTAGHGFTSQAELLAYLVGQASGVAKTLGLQLDVVPMLGPMGQG